jgi:PAS domain S-box-containing protein
MIPEAEKTKEALLEESAVLRTRLVALETALAALPQAANGRDSATRQRLEHALQQQQEWLTVVLSSIGDGVIATDTRGVITFLNPVAALLTGWPMAEALGRPSQEVLRLINAQTRQPVADLVTQVLHEGHILALTQQTVLCTRDGREVAIADSGAPIRTVDGTLQGTVVVFRDVTAQQQLEEELFRVRQIESVGVLAGGIAHDFNNLLTVVLGNISLAKLLASTNAKAVTRLTEAEKACQRAAALTQQLLTFAKGGAPVRDTVELGNLLTESVTFALHGANVRGDLQIAEHLWAANVDARQISQVLHNVVLNAVQAMPNGGTVTVQADNIGLDASSTIPLPAGRYIKVVVHDQGVGIPGDVLPKVFDPYFTTKVAGSGLGLATAYAIVAKHGGYITIASDVGVGTTVVCYLPTAPVGVAGRPQER